MTRSERGESAAIKTAGPDGCTRESTCTRTTEEKALFNSGAIF